MGIWNRHPRDPADDDVVVAGCCLAYLLGGATAITGFVLWWLFAR